MTLNRSVALALLLASPALAQPIIAQPAGLMNASSTVDFGVGLYPNHTPITTEFDGLTFGHARYFTTHSVNNIVGGFLTNDFSGSPDTLTIGFDHPVVDVSFVYQQIGSGAPTTFRALLDGTAVASFSGVWDQYQPNNYFGFTNTLLDEVQVDFVVDFNIDELAFRAGARWKSDNGTGVNPEAFLCLSAPVLGGTWLGRIVRDDSTIWTLVGYAPGGLQSPQPLLGGELLLATTPSPMVWSSSGDYALSMPSSPLWVGTVLALQGFRVDSVAGVPAIVPLNALELTLGY